MVYALLFKFMDNWHWVRVLGNGIIYALIVASAGYFCKYVKLSNYFYIFGTILLLPFSVYYFNYVLKGTYYAVYIIVSFIILGLMFKLSRNNCINIINTINAPKMNKYFKCLLSSLHVIFLVIIIDNSFLIIKILISNLYLV